MKNIILIIFNIILISRLSIGQTMKIHTSTGMDAYNLADIDSITFSTSNDTVGTVTDIDGNIYQTIKIGNQWWMAENLKVTHYRNGDVIPNVTDGIAWQGLSSGAYCIYDNDSLNVANYGLLYNWYAIGDTRNIAPVGWHVPTDEEWKQLEIYLGMSQEEADTTNLRGTDEGGKLKETGTAHWFSPNTGATNESGFNALGGGYRSATHGYYYSMKQFGNWWSATEDSVSYAWNRSLTYSSSQVIRFANTERNGFSIRCVKD